ncbi:hypothetical protein [Sphaerisporangium rhizosphaerae]|uniref:HEAT repeat domain-containing protein n=1 Tax=Sphaerisporangium rhizosphaerae TaxID=2269375 RepID=A0ABW2PAY6_9ACTN
MTVQVIATASRASASDASWHLDPLVEAAEALDLASAAYAVRWSAAQALSSVDHERALDPLLRFGADPASDVRWQVAAGASPAGLCLLPDEAVTVLLRLMCDPDSSVRDWATFTLGVQSRNDTAKIRDALADRPDDTDGNTAGEAAVGLAIRHDPRVLPVLKEKLTNLEVGNLYLEAAEELGDPRFLPHLRQLKEQGWGIDTGDAFYLDNALQTLTEVESG